MATLGMVTLAAQHWHETVAFYHERLGLALIERDDRELRARLEAAPGVVLEIHAGGWASDKRKTTRLNPVALGLRVDDLPTMVRELARHGIACLEPLAGGAVPVLDPDGNRVYLYGPGTPPLVPDGWQLEGEERPAPAAPARP